MSGLFKPVLSKLAAAVGAALIGYSVGSSGAIRRTAFDVFSDAISVKNFGALGDGSGATPASTGVDISAEAWNTWDGTPFKTNLTWSPYGTGGTFVPPRAKPFANDDTWDFIGIQLALWKSAGSGYKTWIPRGNYVINFSSASGKSYGLIIMRGQEQSIIGDGPYETVIQPKESAAFFAANNVGVAGAYPLVELYRTGGTPTNISDMALIGPNGYGTGAGNLTLINCENVNGVTGRDLWLSSAARGISGTSSSGDSHFKGITTEYLFEASVYTDATSDFSVDFCNFWASAAVTNQQGVKALSRTSVTNSRFVNFVGSACTAATGVFSNNLVASSSAGDAVSFTDTCVITGNQINGSSGSSMISVAKNATITGNSITQSAAHACISLGNGASASNITVTGNTLVKTDSTAAAYNYALVAPVSGSNYTEAAQSSVIIANNVIQGRALQVLGSAVMRNNVFDGVMGQTTGDVIGKNIQNATGASGASINITGMLGIGSGAARDIERLNLVMVHASGNSMDGRAYALYTSKWNGSATLIATLGSQTDGGSIVFGSSGTNPTVTGTCNAGGTVSYVINSIPLI